MIRVERRRGGTLECSEYVGDVMERAWRVLSGWICKVSACDRRIYKKKRTTTKAPEAIHEKMLTTEWISETAPKADKRVIEVDLNVQQCFSETEI